MSESYPSDQTTGAAARAGPLGQYIAGYVEKLVGAGYARATIRWRLCLVCVFGRWVDRAQLRVCDLDEEAIEQHVREGLVCGRRCRAIAGALRRFLDHLRAAGVTTTAPKARPCQLLTAVERRYRRFLEEERGLAPPTIENYLSLLRQFLVHRFGEEPVSACALGPRDAADYLLEHAHRVSPGRASLMVTTLRSFFRFLLQHGEIQSDLAAAVPTVANWQRTRLPRYIAPADVERVVQACDRGTKTGRRDYAILLLLARLGLRAGEIVALRLDDVDWRAGTLTVRGKGSRHEKLPLPIEVGKALVGYVRRSRPPSAGTRRFFVRARAPLRGFAGPAAVTTLVRRAIERAGVDAPYRGAHLLRHSLATGMLQKGASLAEIGEILRHRSTNSTEIYAKVDLHALRSVALPWPTRGGVR